jgi:phosphatidylserine/phosphatidylglycerophosphate/cardiolipin synthase-like enzyme
MRRRIHPLLCVSLFVLLAWGLVPARAQAQDRLCDPANEDCRAILLNYIANERVGIDVGFWFMEDARYTAALNARHDAGVPVRVLMDPRANSTYPLNADRLSELQTAGIPMRKRLTNYILHWKMMLFRGQGVVEFSGANYSADGLRYEPSTGPYVNYVDEAIYFTSDASIVNSFREKFDDFWVDTTNWTNYANISGPLTRVEPDGTYAQDPQLNFPPEQNYRTRSLQRYSAAGLASTGKGVDVIMYRITDRQHTDAMIALEGRGLPVRLITEQSQYRDVSRMWHSWNVDRLYMAGVQIKDRAHAGLNHQKSVIIHDQSTTAGDQPLVIFGSSNWTSPSAGGQVEHNMFTSRPYIVDWFVDQFERKWNNLAPVAETKNFVPLPPDAPKNPAPVTGATDVGTTVTLKWFGGPWAHLYDLYLDTNSNPTTLVASNLAETSAKTATSTFSYALPVTLQPGTKYYWKVIGKTMALQTKSSAVWSFTTAGGPPPPPPPPGAGEIVLYASHASLRVGTWGVESDANAAGGAKIRNPNAGAAKITTASANPANYFELTFVAEAGRPYHLWVRGIADSNSWANDSVFVQFSNSVTSSGAATYRIGTTSATEVNLEDCSGCGLQGWGWQDNGWGVGVMGPHIYFNTSGPQTVRIQVREDGFAIDQIVLSPATYLNSSPGSLKNDQTILAENSGG